MRYEFLDPAAIARLGAYPMESRKAMVGSVAGRHRSPHRGSSVEFAEYRKYVPGDDTRRLDWKAFARSDRYYIKEFEADTNLRAYFLLDTSGSMNFGSVPQGSKFDFARRVAATLAYLIVHQGDAVGMSLCHERLHLEIPPSRRPAQLQHLFEALQNTEPTGETGLNRALHEVAEKIPQRGLVAIFSDLFTEPAELAEALQHLSFRKHDVVVFHLLDPQEVDFEFDRPHRFEDLEDGTAIVAEPTLIAEEYQTALAGFLKEVRQTCHDARVDYQLVQTNQNYEELVSDFLSSRLKGSR